MVVHPLLPSLRDRDLEFMLSDVESRLIFVPAQFRKHDYVAMLSRVCARTDRAPCVVVLRGDAGAHTAYEMLLAPEGPAQPLPHLEPDAVQMVLYTSGTTGMPKGVCIATILSAP